MLWVHYFANCTHWQEAWLRELTEVVGNGRHFVMYCELSFSNRSKGEVKVK